ncbi:RND transporter, HAE1/HME family, permease protein [Coleofasciculus chthonoplastes PCC 7420]|uniref:RND transporter, HAE1/HME family, permease protein n=1 Tax=Coleofasciculus chthonoplastes PCC 7420 TaxID=118168 RepID=B4VXV8_9CYAN|nr:efflux RND transporter permease subunit [Coleofasciculus chthonoplastes]EDX73225.1 RND transporter, HAE1/HME family, permease protein [Coleofasciculus chthonoplastes PCC 7420]
MTTNPLSISAIAIRRHIGTLVLTLAVIVLGIFFILQIQVDLLPSITYPRIGLRLGAPGISPEVAVEEITKPLEQGLSATEGVVQVFSQTREGRISLDLFFRPGGDIDQALNDATAAYNRAQSNLPEIIEEPRLFKFDPSQLPVYELALESSSLKDVDLRVFADEELSRELSVVPGVASVDVSGGVTEEVRVLIDPNRLQRLGLGLTDVLDALDERNQDVAGGRLRGEESEPLTRTMGRFQDAAELRNLSFEIDDADATNLSRRVYLRDFAEVIDGTEDRRVFVFLNGEPAVKVSIQKQPDANTIEVVNGVKKRIEQLRQSGLITDDIELVATLDESIFIQNSIANVTSAGLIGATLAAFAVLLFLGSLRQTLIIVIAIPLATLAAVILMKLFGLSLNVFSLGGLALGVGIVVDNAIVMLETIAAGVSDNPSVGTDLTDKVADKTDNGTQLAPSQSIISQAEQCSQEVESALIASTSTNLVAVLPFLLIGGFFSLLFSELILTISFAVAASLVVALTVVPMLSSRLLAIPRSSGLNRFWLLQTFNRRFAAATRSYQGFLARVLRYRILVIALAVLILGGGSLALASQIPQEILPRIDTGQARMFAQFPPGTTLEQNRQVMMAVDDILLAQPETEYAFTTSGGFLFGGNTSENLLRGTSTIALKSDSNVETFIGRVNQELQTLNLVQTRLRLSPGEVRGIILSNSPVRGADLDIGLQGTNTQQLEAAGRQVLKALDERATLAQFRPDADDRQPEIQIRPDWERVAQLGLTAQEIGDTIQTAIAGSVSTQLQRGDRLVDVRVQLDQAAIQRVSQIKELPLFTTNNRQIKLGDVAAIDQGQAPGEIQRINQRQVFLIAGTLNEGATLSEALAETNAVLAELDLPEGVSILPSSASETNQQLQNSLKILGGLAAFMVFVVMAVQYNSLIDPLVIMLTVPLALAGGILGLYVTQTAMGATVLVGAVLLVGIVVNNAIVMVEFANQIYYREKVDRKTAILQAAPQRLRPILMTTITTVLGLFPLALGIGKGSEFLQPLGVVVFSGLSLATGLTLFIIPCFYTLLHDSFGDKNRKKGARGRTNKKNQGTENRDKTRASV